MENDKIHDYTDAYLESYLRALDKTHNPDLAIQTAMGVTAIGMTHAIFIALSTGNIGVSIVLSVLWII